MANYRIIADRQSRSFACDTDEDAIVWAQQLADDASAELWSGERLVRRLSPEARLERGRAVTHQIRQGRLVPK
jgi:hypothetical protein